jgi:hypothetical protein
MATEPRTIEIGNMPDVLRIVDQVRKTRTSRVLSRGKKPLAILRPLPSNGKRGKRAKSKKDYEAFLASSGSWKDVDTDRLVRDIYESREIVSRSPIQR